MYRKSRSSRRRRSSRSHERREHHKNRHSRHDSSQHRHRHRRSYSPRRRASTQYGRHVRRRSSWDYKSRRRTYSPGERSSPRHHRHDSRRDHRGRRYYSHRRHTHRRRRSGSRGKSNYKDKSSRKSEEEIVHFKWDPGMKLGEYKVVGKIADGTFGRVLRCERGGKHFAVKVVRDVDKYTSSAQIEADILKDIQKVDDNGESHCVVLHDQFMFKERIMCLVFEQLGDSLYEFLKRNEYKGFFVADIQRITFQLLKGLSFLKKNRLIHTDLKPENVLLTCGRNDYIEVPFPRSTTGMTTRRPATADIKIIDFGSTIYDDDYHSTIINTRQYRSPEVILDVGWSYASDMWSLGCILIEMYTGDLLFNTHSHLEHLAMMEQTIGSIPEEMLEKARTTEGKKYVHPEKLALNWPEGARSNNSRERVKLCRNVLELVKPEHRTFAEFIKYILNPDPAKRPTPEDAMQHEFLALSFPEN